MANLRFSIGIRREFLSPLHTLKKIILNAPPGRIHTIPRLPPCSHDPNRHRHNIALYVSPLSSPPFRTPSTPTNISLLPKQTALLLAGCSSSSPLIPNIFLISLYYQTYPPTFDPAQVDPGVTTAIANIVGRAKLQVRVGYFGICINPDGGAFLCSNNASSLASQVSVDQDPLNLIWVANTFKDSIVFPYLM